MPDTATATTSTTTTTDMALSSLPTSGSSTPESDLSHSTIPPFTPGQCLFCPHPSPLFLDSIEHMQRSHGLFIPDRQTFTSENLESLFEHLHLIVFGYQECIKCGTTRASVQAIQQHMTGKPGHCTFDISDPDSEFAELYRQIFEKAATEDQEDNEQETPNVWNKPRTVQVDEDSLRLPSGRIISKKSSATPPAPSATNSSRLRHHRTRMSAAATEIEYTLQEEPINDVEEPAQPSNSETAPGTQVVLSKRERKRARAIESYQLTRMGANDRTSLMHLPVSQQRALLATQQRHQEKMQTEERRQRAKIDRKGNKNLYAYWNTETPVYQCG
ncbi:C2H2 type zinc-finger-domain-containing protein [Cercophora samala]|uniref:C2H2 type zinc-finger-domain-containing protein n=1 Tax=Cercophora samala TaxID=330535 RepID=A0AA39ZBX4_9PEZI|nr:C2H2 type zinc-finger-domain-containing protein [Cercophora samala]